MTTHHDSNPTPGARRRELRILLGVWLVLAAAWLWLGSTNTAVPGLNYDEAIFTGMAKDFTAGEVHGRHMPGAGAVDLWNRPFPLWIQPYLGAVKSWQLIPLFTFFEPGMALARLSNLAWALAGLLFFMLWVWKLFGLAEAMAGGVLLALDPAFYFLSLLDWGAFVPSFVCRCAGFFFVLLAWRDQKIRYTFLAGAALGLGFFNKVDFGVVLFGTTLAALCAYARPIFHFIRARPKLVILAALGFLAGSGPMTLMFPRVFKFALANNAPINPGEFTEKLQALTAMYDGSYFYRLMDVGGVFDKMPQLSPPVWTPLGIVVAAAFILLTVEVVRWRDHPAGRAARIFLLAALVLTTVGVFMLPRAVRIYHAVLAMPFAHLTIAVAGMGLWRKFSTPGGKRIFARGAVALVFMALLLMQGLAIGKTEGLIHATHGRGWWSDALGKYAVQVKERSDLTLVSLDWGFHEPLLFFTEKPLLVEPFWHLTGIDPAKLPQNTNYVYFVHPPEFSLSPFGATYLNFARQNPRAKIADWRDYEGNIVFYTVQFTAP